MVTQAEQEMTGNSLDIIAARQVLQIGPASLHKINETNMHKAVNRVLVYRILDVCQWVKSQEMLSQPSVVPRLSGPHQDLIQKLVSNTPCSHHPTKYYRYTSHRKHQRCTNGLRSSPEPETRSTISWHLTMHHLHLTHHLIQYRDYSSP